MCITYWHAILLCKQCYLSYPDWIFEFIPALLFQAPSQYVYRLLYIFIVYPRVIQLQLNFINNEMNYGSSGVHSRHSQCTTQSLKPSDQQLVDK